MSDREKILQLKMAIEAVSNMAWLCDDPAKAEKLKDIHPTIHGLTWDEIGTSIDYFSDRIEALVAAEREACEQACVSEYLENEPETDDDAAYDRAVADCIAAIRTRTNDDARAAIERVKEKARNEALREAINLINGCDRVSEVQPAIETLIKEEQSDES